MLTDSIFKESDYFEYSVLTVFLIIVSLKFFDNVVLITFLKNIMSFFFFLLWIITVKGKRNDNDFNLSLKVIFSKILPVEFEFIFVSNCQKK